MPTEKKGNLLQKINIVTHGQFEELLLTYDICPLCAEDGAVNVLQKRKGLLTCLTCGFLPEQQTSGSNLPFEYAGAPENRLLAGHGLGGTIQKFGQFCVLAHSSAYDEEMAFNVELEKNGLPAKTHLPMSAKFYRIITGKIEDPRMQTLLRVGRTRCADWGFDPKSREGVQLWNHLGDVLREVGKYVVVQNKRCNLTSVSDACFAVALKDVRGETDFRVAVEKLKVNMPVLENVLMIWEARKP